MFESENRDFIKKIEKRTNNEKKLDFKTFIMDC